MSKYKIETRGFKATAESIPSARKKADAYLVKNHLAAVTIRNQKNELIESRRIDWRKSRKTNKYTVEKY